MFISTNLNNVEALKICNNIYIYKESNSYSKLWFGFLLYNKSLYLKFSEGVSSFDQIIVWDLIQKCVKTK